MSRTVEDCPTETGMHEMETHKMPVGRQAGKKQKVYEKT